MVINTSIRNGLYPVFIISLYCESSGAPKVNLTLKVFVIFTCFFGENILNRGYPEYTFHLWV